MIVRTTAKLAKQIGVEPLAAPPLAENPYVDWTCRVFDTQSGDMLMLISNTASLYSLLAPANGLNNREQFGYGFIRYLERRLLEDGFGDIFSKCVVPSLETIVLTKSLNRSVTGSMTDMVKLTQFMLAEGKSLDKIAADLNRTPFQALNYRFPCEQFLDPLNQESRLQFKMLGPKNK